MLKRISGLILLVACLAFAKSYTFRLSVPAEIGGALLKPGEYSLKLDAEQIVLTDKDHRKIETNATVEISDNKFDQTSLLISNADRTSRIQSVQLGGTNKKVVFH